MSVFWRVSVTLEIFNWKKHGIKKKCITRQIINNKVSRFFNICGHFSEFPHNLFPNQKVFFVTVREAKVFGWKVESLIPGHEILGLCDYGVVLVVLTPKRLLVEHQVSYWFCWQYLGRFLRLLPVCNKWVSTYKCNQSNQSNSNPQNR